GRQILQCRINAHEVQIESGQTAVTPTSDMPNRQIECLVQIFGRNLASGHGNLEYAVIDRDFFVCIHVPVLHGWTVSAEQKATTSQQRSLVASANRWMDYTRVGRDPVKIAVVGVVTN